MIYFSKNWFVKSKFLNIANLRKQSLGFSLVELMIGIAVLAILLSIAVPSFRTMIINSQVRNAAESIANGLQKARAEAVARNTNVTFVLAAGTNTSWTVNQVAPATVIESRDSGEGSANVTRTEVPAGETTVTFSNLGRVIDATPITQINLTATDSTKSLRVTIGAGGNVRMCDPSISSGPRAC